MAALLNALNVQEKNSKALRFTLRNIAFKNWCNLKYADVGAIDFENYTPSNYFVESMPHVNGMLRGCVWRRF